MALDERIAVVGLGYVGLPVAIAMARRFAETTGFDINPARVDALRAGNDWTGEIAESALRTSQLRISADPSALEGSTFFIVAVPTPIDVSKRPELTPLETACEIVASALVPGSVVVFESTVYPGVTEDVCAPILARVSGLRRHHDFTVAYSPERINPGDKMHSFDNIVKVVAAENEEALERVASVYEAVVPAGVYRAKSIKVAEAAKVIENTQRDLNVALMNELSIIFAEMGLRSRDVLAAANTKWNFLPFTPGLVGGHCIGVDPYYLTYRAEQLGYHPQVILAGRRINDGMGAYVASAFARLLAKADASGTQRRRRVGILGLTFKEDVRDIRNSRVPDIVRELQVLGVEAIVHDPLASQEEAFAEYGLHLASWEALTELDGLLIAVPHMYYRKMSADHLLASVRRDGAVFDVKSMLDPDAVPAHLFYQSL